MAGFALMASYGIVRPLARAVFSFDARFMLWGMAATPLLVTLLIWPYGWALSRLGPRRTILWSSVLSASLLVLPFLVRHPYLTFFLYVWKDVYVVLLVEQFWSLANSSHSIAQGKRRFGALLFIGGLGAVSGNQLVALLAEPLGSWTVYLGAILVLVPFALLMDRAHQGGEEEGASQPGKEAVDGHALGMLARSPLLFSIACIVALGQVMAGALEVVFTQHVETAYAFGATLGAQDARAAFEGRFWTAVNLGSMSVQLLIPLLLRRLSVRLVHLLIPMSHGAALAALLVYPSLTTAALAFAWFKVLDYSLFRASKEVLYVPLDFASRYRVKMLIDMTIYRTAKGGSGLVLYGLSSVVVAVGRLFALTALGAVLLWTFFAWKIGRGFAKFEEQAQNGSVADQDGGS
jgi:AAA family ATP:ADP antiporter